MLQKYNRINLMDCFFSAILSRLSLKHFGFLIYHYLPLIYLYIVASFSLHFHRLLHHHGMLSSIIWCNCFGVEMMRQMITAHNLQMTNFISYDKKKKKFLLLTIYLQMVQMHPSTVAFLFRDLNLLQICDSVLKIE